MGGTLEICPSCGKPRSTNFSVSGKAFMFDQTCNFRDERACLNDLRDKASKWGGQQEKRGGQ
jgi:hypothetical protein